MSCSDFVEVNKMLTAEVLRPAGAARSKGLGCFPTRPLCIDKDIACKALCVQKHCLPRLCWYHGALIANARPPARVAERLDEDEVSQTHIIDSVGRQQGVSYSELLSADGDAASVFFRC